MLSAIELPPNWYQLKISEKSTSTIIIYRQSEINLCEHRAVDVHFCTCLPHQRHE